MKQYLYVVQSESGLVKVGVSANPEVRANQLRTGSGYKLTTVFRSGPFNAATRLEGMVHRSLKEHRQHGEWFRCSPECAVDAATVLSGSFIDDECREEASAELREQLFRELISDPNKRLSDSIDRQLEKLFQKYEESVDLNASLADQVEEAGELLEWYSDQLKQALFIGRTAMDRSIRLEKELAVLKKHIEPGLLLN